MACSFLAEGPLQGSDRTFSQAWVDENGQKTVMRHVERRIDDDERAGEDSLERIRAILTEFLGHYAGTINQLDKDDRVTVLYRPQTHRFPALYDLKADAKNIDIDVEVITGAFQTGGWASALPPASTP